MSNRRRISTITAVTGALALSVSSQVMAQRPVAFSNGFPVAPTGLQNLPLADGPWDFRTGEAMNIHVELVTRMEYPMALQFLPDQSLLVPTRRGVLYHYANGRLTEVAGGPPSVFLGESGGIGSIHGYMDVKLHPDFANNHYIYLLYTRTDPMSPVGIMTLGRAKLENDRLSGFEIIYDTKNLSGAGCIAFGSDGKLYMSTPDRDSQNLASLGGKILRLNDDGSVPKDNPFVNKADALPEIYSYGHRFALGMAVHPRTGELWESENGPNGGDEINIIKPGVDYGWPAVSFGRDYQGPWHGGKPSHEGYEMPVVYWMPSIAVAGIAFYTGNALPKWNGDLFIGSMREGEVNGTGHLDRVLMNANNEELRRESLLVDLHKRIRAVAQGPDGYLYVALEDRDGGVLRIMPGAE
ncbi:MAG: PQQ-dependent sugar dehydrogenase [Gammaproteobacteria bacterium]|nr:PQQ-dependent sugar dehydrogenase [Gammaproteobacteria bacterium]